MAESLFFWLAVASYVGATALFWVSLIFEKERLLRTAVAALWPALVFHSVAILIRWFEQGHGPYISRYEVFSSNSWMVIATYLVLQLFFRQIRPVGAAVVPVVLIMLGMAATFPAGPSQLPPTFGSNWLIVHILFAKMAFGSFLIATGMSVFYLIKTRISAIKTAWTSNWLPRIEIMDELVYRFNLLGFFALAVMIIAGSLWAHKSWGRYWGWDPVETWSLLTWLVYGIYIHLRRTRGWKGRKAAWFSIAAFSLVIIMAFGVTLFIASIHSYYFIE